MPTLPKLLFFSLVLFVLFSFNASAVTYSLNTYGVNNGNGYLSEDENYNVFAVASTSGVNFVNSNGTLNQNIISPASGYTIYDAIVSSNGKIYVATNNGIFVRADGGTSSVSVDTLDLVSLHSARRLREDSGYIYYDNNGDTSFWRINLDNDQCEFYMDWSFPWSGDAKYFYDYDIFEGTVYTYSMKYGNAGIVSVNNTQVHTSGADAKLNMAGMLQRTSDGMIYFAEFSYNYPASIYKVSTVLNPDYSVNSALSSNFDFDHQLNDQFGTRRGFGYIGSKEPTCAIMYGFDLQIVNVDSTGIPIDPPEPEPDYLYFTDPSYSYNESVLLRYNQCANYEDMGYVWNPAEPLYYWHKYLVLTLENGDYYNNTFYPLGYDYIHEGVVNPSEGLCWQTESFDPSFTYPYLGQHLRGSLIERSDYYFGVYGVSGRFIGSSDTVLDSDITVLLTVNGTIPDGNITDPVSPPDPLNQTDPVAPPDPWNGTPPVTPDPGVDYEENKTYNSSFLSTYYTAVDDMADGLFSPVESIFSYLLGPVNSLNTSVNQGSAYFDQASGSMRHYDGAVMVLFVPLINALPNKLVNLVTYYLAWLLVIMLLRRR
ncbi:hypothetical protein V7O62_09895 [Methanolobus sp. ZRKC2]|uniref:hypothetical protein n=1 Tax=Methanolobus sp. ZRKC2 TaxID=3125783 RepID=UPI00324B2E67